MAAKRKPKRKAKPDTPARRRTVGLLTPAIHEAIVKAVSLGSYATTAARAAGIREATFSHWMREARADETAGDASDYLDLMRAIDKADAQAENVDLGDVDDPKWRLERTRPERYGQRITIDATKAAVSHLLDILRDGVSDGAYDEVIAALGREGM